MAEQVPPMPWQSDHWSGVGRQLDQDNLHHATVLSGPVGIGKTRFARALAARLLCESPQHGLNCGQCHACELLAAGNHGDCLTVVPGEGVRPTIKIEQIRALVTFLSKTASFGQRKVVLISQAHTMNINAANALLKSLEEPTADSYLILVTDQPQRLPATVRSRCQMTQFPRPTPAECSAWLDALTGSRERSEELLMLAEGAPLIAASLLEDEDRVVSLRQIVEVLTQLGSHVLSPVQAGQTLGAIDNELLLAQMRRMLRERIAAQSAETLRSDASHGLFSLLDSTNEWQRRLNAGVNPNADLLKQQLLLDFSAGMSLQ